MIDSSTIIHHDDELAIGEFATERDVADDFDKRIEATKAFRVYREVTGEIFQPRVGTRSQGIRIDRVLLPLPATVAAGWNLGAVGIELKRTGEKIGPVISQAIDYQRACWRLEPSGVLIVTEWVFLWPFRNQMFALASIMAQQRIGVGHFSSWNQVVLSAGSSTVFSIRDGLKEIKPCQCGKKTGSR